MANFKLSDEEIDNMRRMYEAELDQTLRRLQHIQAVLNGIGGKQTIDVRINQSGTNSGTSVSTPKATTATKTTRRKGKKRGPKSVWKQFVLDKLKNTDKPYTYNEIIDEAMKFSNMPADKEKNVRQSIINTTFKLRTEEDAIDTFSLGNRIKYLALKSWFDANGKIKPEYASKASMAKPAPTRRRKKAKTTTAKRSAASTPAEATAKAATPKSKAAPVKAASIKTAAPKKETRAKKTTATKKTSVAKKSPTKSATTPSKAAGSAWSASASKTSAKKTTVKKSSKTPTAKTKTKTAPSKAVTKATKTA